MNWKHQTKISAFFVMILLTLHYLGATAFAEFGFAPPPASDMSRSFLNQIFGGLLDGGQDAFGASIKNFNAGVLVIGGILAAYTIFAGTLGTAHDGEMLGKKFSSVWIPIRYALGTALVLPVLSGGYCIMQGIVMWLIMQGVSLANGVWSEYMSDPPGLRALASPTPSNTLVSLAENIYLMQVCVAGNQFLRGSGAVEEGSVNLYWSDPDVKYDARKDPIDQGNGIILHPNDWIFGYHGTMVFGNLTCGKVSHPVLKKNTNTSGDSDISSVTGGNKEYNIPSFSTLKDSFKSPSYAPVLAKHIEATDTLVTTMGTLAQSNIGKDKTPAADSYQKIYAAALAYQTTIAAEAKTLLDTQNNIKEASTANGWFVAGAWITQIIINQNKLNAAVTNFPSAKNINYHVDGDDKADDFLKITGKAVGVISPTNATASAFLGQAKNSDSKKGKNKDSKIDSSSFDVSGFLVYFVTGLDLESIRDDKRHPLIIMSTVGNSILSTVLGAVFLMGAVSIATAAIPVIGNSAIAGLLVFFGSFSVPIAGFIGIGATLAYLLPNLPFLLWIGIIIGWTVMCVEAILAAPLWAVMHLHPNGDDLTGRGGNGYMLVLGLLLRPVLIIFGLIAAITLSGLFGQFINLIFLDVFMLNQGDQAPGFFATLFGAGLYAAMMMTVIKQTFNLMHMIPDQLLRWIGGGQEQLGQYAGASSDSMTKASTIGGAAAGLATTQVAQGAIAGMNEKKNIDKANASKEASLSSEAAGAESKLGSGAGDVFQAINKSNGDGSSLASTQQKSAFGNASSSFSDPSMKASFHEQMNKNLGAGQGFQEAMGNSLTHTIGNHLGGGGKQGAEVADFAKKLSGGQNGEWPKDSGGNLNTAAIGRTIGSMSELHQGAGSQKGADGSQSFDSGKAVGAIQSAVGAVNSENNSVGRSGEGMNENEMRNGFNSAKEGILNAKVEASRSGDSSF